MMCEFIVIASDTHIDNREAAIVVVGGHRQDNLQLGDEDVEGSRCGEPSHQGVRQVTHQEAHL